MIGWCSSGPHDAVIELYTGLSRDQHGLGTKTRCILKNGCAESNRHDE